MSDESLLKDFWEGLIGADEEGFKNTLTVPSEEPLSWETGGVVRLDVVIYALHLMTARACFRSLTGMARQKQSEIERKLAEKSGTFVVGRFIRSLGTVLAFVFAFVDIFSALKIKRQQEEAIRRASIRTLRELRVVALSQKRGGGRGKGSVQTRNPEGRRNRGGGN